MHHLLSHLILYSDLAQNGVLSQFGEIYRDLENDGGFFDKNSVIQRIYWQIKYLLEVAMKYGFEGNLWQDYLTLLLVSNENPFSLNAERTRIGDGSICRFVRNDCAIFIELFHFDFGPLEKQFGLDCFQTITHYAPLSRGLRSDLRAAGDWIRPLSRKLAAARDGDEFFLILTDFYGRRGAGAFGLNRAFHAQNEDGTIQFVPIGNPDPVLLSDLIGYEVQKQALTQNTEAFIRGLPANNALLYGDAGAGKSSCVKALLNEYFDAGLRMVELNKYQFHELPAVIAALKRRNYRFIIYIDDLSFEENETEYKFLKAVIEGGVEIKPDNVLLYATSNRRHLIKETWAARDDMEYSGELHHSETVEEQLSLAARFGVTINFNAPTREQYHDIVRGLARRRLETRPPDAELLKMADRWELRHGGVSGRTAQQFIDYLAGQEYA